MHGNEKFPIGLARQKEFAIGEIPVLEARVDADLILTILERFTLRVGQTETPVFLVIRRPPGNPFGLFWDRVEMGLKRFEGEMLANRNAVADDMEIRVADVDNRTTRRVVDPCFA